MDFYCRHCGHRLGSDEKFHIANILSWKCKTCKMENSREDLNYFSRYYTYEEDERETLKRAHHDRKLYLKLVRRYANGH